MTIRAIWIVSVTPGCLGKVLYSRKFPTVERRAEIAHGTEYVSLPSDENFSMAVLFTLGLTEESKQFVEWRDKASHIMHLPAVSIKIGKKDLFPVLIIEQVSSLLCCLPLKEKDETTLLNNPSVSTGFAVLIGVLNFIGPSSNLKSKRILRENDQLNHSDKSAFDKLAQKFLELDNYLTLSMPFGTPSDSDPLTVINFYKTTPALMSKKKKSGSQEIKKIRSSVFLEVNEFVRSTQCGQQNTQSVIDVYGSIIATVDSSSHINDVSVTLEHSDMSKTLYLKSLIIHPCVQTFTSIGGEGVAGVPKKLWFVPPSHRFTLCFYSAVYSIPPIQGIFKLKGNTSIELLVQLKLLDSIQNSFDFCDVFIPFHNRGPVLNFAFKSTQGALQISEDKHSLKWNIGTKFSSKSLEVILTAKVDFSSGPLQAYSDPFCVHKNSYIQVNFRQRNSVLSGCNIDPKSVVVSPAHKAKIHIERTVQSTEYRIWNTFGDLPYPEVPEECIPKQFIADNELFETV